MSGYSNVPPQRFLRVTVWVLWPPDMKQTESKKSNSMRFFVNWQTNRQTPKTNKIIQIGFETLTKFTAGGRKLNNETDYCEA